MKEKNKLKSEVFNSTPLRRKSRLPKNSLSIKPEFTHSFGKDAETIRREVMAAKKKLKKHPSFFEMLGENDLLELEED